MRVGISCRFLLSDSEARSQPRGIILGEAVYSAAICELSDRFGRRRALTWNYCACRPTSPFLEIVTCRVRGQRLQGPGRELDAQWAVSAGKTVFTNLTDNWADRANPSDEPAKRSDEPAKRSDGVAKRSDEGAKASDQPAKRSDKPAKAADEAAKRSDEGAEASDEPAKAADGVAKPSDEPAKATDDPAKAADGLAKTADDSAKQTARNPDGSDDRRHMSAF